MTPDPGSDAYTELQTSLPGTVQAHRCHVFLTSSTPPSQFPKRHTTAIQRALQLRLTKLGGLVNFAWYGGEQQSPATTSATTSRSDTQSAVAFTPLGGRLDIPEVSLENLDDVEARLRRLMEGPITPGTDREIHLFVCTHGARDCRCGRMGGRVAKALREEVRKIAEEGEGLGPAVRVGEVGHVGGHQYAANLLVLPHGDWLGLVRPENVPEILSAIIQRPTKPLTENDPLLVRSHWRGRMGLGKDEQLELFKGQSSE